MFCFSESNLVEVTQQPSCVCHAVPAGPMLIKGPPVNRKGEVLPTISGGAGGSRGFAYLRGGPYPVWFGGSGAPISSRVTWCGLAGVAIDGLPPELTSEEVRFPSVIVVPVFFSFDSSPSDRHRRCIWPMYPQSVQCAHSDGA